MLDGKIKALVSSGCLYYFISSWTVDKVIIFIWHSSKFPFLKVDSQVIYLDSRQVNKNHY